MRKDCIYITIFLTLLLAPTYSFDTGHHSDITRNALDYFGFSDDTIKIVQVLNWVVDFYSVNVGKKLFDFQLLHCDTLRNTTESVCYWNNLSHAMKIAITDAAKDKDIFGLVSLLGFSLHSVQDFYSHSSWVETHSRNGSCSCYRSDTYFSYAGGDLSKLPNIFSDACDMCKRVEDRITPIMVPHGAYCSGINKDSIVRPNHEEAYVFAFVASVEWVNATKLWIEAVDPKIWSQIIAFNEVDYTSDLKTHYEVTLWLLTSPTNDGHWKGSGSGIALRGLMRYLYWSIKPDSPLISRVKTERIFERLTHPSPYTPCSFPPPANSSLIAGVSQKFKSTMKAVILRTTEIFKTAQYDISSLVKRNFTDVPKTKYSLYAKVVIDGQEFVEPTQKSIVHPFWTSIKIVDMSKLDQVDPTINITYQLWQENSWKADSVEDLNPLNNQSYYVTLIYHINTERVEGDFEGFFNNPHNVITAKGAMSYVKFFITSSSLTGCGDNVYYGPVSENSPSQCAFTAVARNGQADVCTERGANYVTAQFRYAIIALSLPVGFLVLGCLLGGVLFGLSRRRHNRREANLRKYVSIPSFDPQNVSMLQNDNV